MLFGGAAALVVVLGAGAAYVLHIRHEGRDIKGSSSVEFVPTATTPMTTASTKPTTTTAPTKVQEKPGIVWPMYGNDPAR